jgi:hypothetical protein
MNFTATDTRGTLTHVPGMITTPTLATRFARSTRVLRSNTPLTEDQILQVGPSIFAADSFSLTPRVLRLGQSTASARLPRILQLELHRLAHALKEASPPACSTAAM